MNTSRNVKIFFVEEVEKLALDTGISCEDVEYVLRRFNNEGIRFLTFTLPSLSKAVLSSIESGEFIRPTTFAWKRKSLYFMYSFLSRIFCPSTGKLLDDACPYALKSIRQFCEYFYKLAFDSSVEEKEAGEAKYLENEALVKDFEPDALWCDKLRKNLITFYKEFSNTPVNQVLEKHRPRFGPGSFAAKSCTTNKTLMKKLSSDFIGITTKEFSALSGYFKSYPSSPERISLVEEDKTSVVTFVAKDARGPRVISMEPMHLLRAQMSYLDWSITVLEKTTDGRIQFTDQTRNNSMAQRASVDRRYATLDLKDASDRVSYKLVSRVFSNTLAPAYFLKNARSTHTLLPSGKIIPLRKVAGMGSGLTFPTMALIIHLSICTLVSERFGVPYAKAMRSVYVYGDDVIVPTCWYDIAVRALTASGLLVNVEKSYYKSHFRESCGGDFYKGVNVTPVKLKLDKVDLSLMEHAKVRVIRGSKVFNTPCLKLDNDRQLYKLNMHTRELFNSSLLNLKEHYDDMMRTTFGARNYPEVGGSSSLVGEYTDVICKDNIRVKAYTLVPLKQKSSRICPYKYLSTKFMRKSHTTYDIIRDKIVNSSISYGEYVLPRDMKLVLRTHTGMKTY